MVFLTSLLISIIPIALAQNSVLFGPDVAYVSPEWNSVFPAANFNRNISVPFWETSTLVSDSAADAVEQTLEKFLNVSFIVYDESFYQLLKIDNYTQPKGLEVIFEFPPKPSFAARQVHDGTVYSPEAKAIFFAQLHVPLLGYSADAMPWLWRIDISNHSSPVTERVYPSPQLTVANGATYYNGSVFWAQEGNYTNPGGIVKMDPFSLKTEVVQNNFYGHRYNSPNDLVITNTGTAFFTDGYYGQDNFNDTLPAQLANGIYRWEQSSGNIRMVAGAAEGAFFNPNGLALSPDDDYLYITNRGNTSTNPAGARTIYRYGITPTGIRDREIFAYVDAGFPDGIKTDREGRVYAGVTAGVDVFSPTGVLIGRIKVANGDTAVNQPYGAYSQALDKAYKVRYSLRSSVSALFHPLASPLFPIATPAPSSYTQPTPPKSRPQANPPQTAETVYLIFSANKSGEYYGYAVMTSPINQDFAATIAFAPAPTTSTNTASAITLDFAPEADLVTGATDEDLGGATGSGGNSSGKSSGDTCGNSSENLGVGSNNDEDFPFPPLAGVAGAV
ncbi:hypothetical protein V499_00629 [Pseudogymnoascus sp. VKM F-103]|nr:hypothetical protein V499_00629 [Pseudogymnoascus sp. VKM F-103]